MEGAGVIDFKKDIPLETNIKVARKSLNEMGIMVDHYLYFTKQGNIMWVLAFAP